MNFLSPFILLALGLVAPVFAQSERPGTVLVRADFSSERIERGKWGHPSWNYEGNWKLADGALRGVYVQQPGATHGKPVRALIDGHRNLRVTFRFRIEKPLSRLEVLPNGKFSFSPYPHEHIARLRLSLGGIDAGARWSEQGGRDLGLIEDGYTEDAKHPKLPPDAKAHARGGFRFYDGSASSGARLTANHWHRAVLEIIGQKWTAWIDGREALTLTVRWPDLPVHSVDFLSNGLILLDDLVIERL